MVKNPTGKHNMLPSTHKLDLEAWAAPALARSARSTLSLKKSMGNKSPDRREYKTSR